MATNWFQESGARHDWPCGFLPGKILLASSDHCKRCGWSWWAHIDRPEGEPHHPNRWHLCDDPDCCDDGCPVLTCAVDGENWPCTTKQAHVAARAAACIG